MRKQSGFTLNHRSGFALNSARTNRSCVESGFALNSKSGFTLLELLVVISIIGLLASVVVFGYSGWSEKARLANEKQFSQSLRSSLTAYVLGSWTFDDGTAKDLSGNGNNGTVYGATAVVGAMGNALSFDGNNDYVSIGKQVLATNVFTISAWIKPSRYGGGSANGIVYQGTGFADLGTVFFASDFSSPCVATLGARVAGGNYACAGDNVITLNIWQHVIMVVRGNGDVDFYVNGKLTRTATGMGTGTPSNNFNIGYWYNAADPSRFFQGQIDDVAVYREAFTAFQVQQLYAKGLTIHQAVAVK